MPRQVFHLKIAYIFAQKNKEYNVPEFYLGCISPDAIKVYGKVTEEEKNKTHFKCPNFEKWKNNVISFYFDNKLIYNKAFLIGYCIHILTDILYDETYGKIVKKKLESQKIKAEFLKDEFVEQMRKYEISQLNEKWWLKVKYMVEIADGFEFNNITKKTILDWKRKVLEDYSRKLISDSLIKEKFINEKIIKDMSEVINEFYHQNYT